MRRAGRELLPDLVANLRDLGGLRTAAGAVLRPRRLLRSSTLVHLPPASLDALAALLGPAIYFDLRTDDEVGRDGGAEALVERGWSWVRIPLRDRSGEPGEEPDPAARHRAALPRYLAAADAVTTRLLGQPLPGLISCSLGKDRTGVVTALLLHRIGVPPPDIGADYELSNARLAECRRLLFPRWRDESAAIHPVTARDVLSLLSLDTAPAGEVARLRDDLLAAGAVGMGDR